MLRIGRMLMFVLALSLAVPALAHAQVTTGSPAPDFTLADSKGQSHSLSQYKGKYVVLEWLNYDCPFVKKHYGSGNMQSLQKDLTGKGVVWLAVNSSALNKEGYYPADKTNELNAANSSAASAVLLDTDGKVGKQYAAQTTPHMFIINPDGVVIYQGAIDDKPSTDAADIAGAKNYVKAAFDEAMAGKPVTDATTKSYGCSVKY